MKNLPANQVTFKSEYRNIAPQINLNLVCDDSCHLNRILIIRINLHSFTSNGAKYRYFCTPLV